MTHGGVSAPSNGTFTHRVAFEEVSGPSREPSLSKGSPGGWRKPPGFSEGGSGMVAGAAPADTVQLWGAKEAMVVLAYTDAMTERHRRLKL